MNNKYCTAFYFYECFFLFIMINLLRCMWNPCSACSYLEARSASLLQRNLAWPQPCGLGQQRARNMRIVGGKPAYPGTAARLSRYSSQPIQVQQPAYPGTVASLSRYSS
jgi:hypothetical protein